MIDRIQSYYRGERISNLAFAGYALSAILFSFGYNYMVNSPLSFGFLCGVTSIAIFQAIVGLGRFYKTFNLFNSAKASVLNKNDFLIKVEYPRIKNLVSRFKTMRTAESIILVLGILFFSIGAVSNANQFFLGTAAAIILQSGVMLAFDLFGQFRTQEYEHQLTKLDDNLISDLY